MLCILCEFHYIKKKKIDVVKQIPRLLSLLRLFKGDNNFYFFSILKVSGLNINFGLLPVFFVCFCFSFNVRL